MDEAEQLCDRLVVMDKAPSSPRAARATSSPSTRPGRWWSCGSAVGCRRRLDGRLDGLAKRIETLPDRLLLYTDDGDAAVAEVHSRGLEPEAVAGPAEHPRGRVPAAHRTQPDRLTAMAVSTTLRVFETHARTYRHTWPGGLISTFLNPVLFLAAMGVGLGTMVDSGSGTSRSRGCPMWPSWRPACSPRRRCRPAPPTPPIRSWQASSGPRPTTPHWPPPSASPTSSAAIWPGCWLGWP